MRHTLRLHSGRVSGAVGGVDTLPGWLRLRFAPILQRRYKRAGRFRELRISSSADAPTYATATHPAPADATATDATPDATATDATATGSVAGRRALRVRR